MNAEAAACPSKQSLAEYGLGKLDNASSATIENHLETCADCRSVVDQVPADSFVDRLQQAQASPQSAKAPLRSQADAISMLGDSISSQTDRSETASPTGQPVAPKHARAASLSNVPTELAGHPDYEMLRELGHGGMGVVYLARNRMMDRLEVLKVVSKSLLARPGALERFQQEIRAAAKLSHPNIVAAYSVLRPGDLLVFAMEYVEGQDLAQVVKQRGPLPVTNATFYAQQVALGLQHAHEKGMVHRDVKPNNLMLAIVNKKHVVKILDFGLAKATSEKGDDHGLTKSGQMLGTPDFIAPEQTLDAQKADIRADIYSLGCTLYYLLAGHPPFSGASLYEVLHAHHHTEAEALHRLRPDVTEELAAIVSKMLAKDPAQRFQTPLEVAKALNPFFKAGAQLPPQVPPTPLPPAPVAGEIPGVRAASAAPIPIAQPLVPTTVPASLAPMASLVDIHAGADPRRKASRRNRRRAPLLVGAGLLPILLLAAGIMFKLRTTDGVVAIAVNEPHPEIFVDGNKALVAWDSGGTKAEITLPAGSRKIELKKDGFKLIGETIELERGGRSILTATLEPLPPAPPRPSSKPAPSLDLKLARSYKTLQGEWRIVGDELVQDSFFDDCMIVFGDPAWKDYDFACEVKMTTGGRPADKLKHAGGRRQVGLLYGVTGKEINVLVLGGSDAGFDEAYSFDNGARWEFGRRQIAREYDRWYNVEIRLRGPHRQCFVDDQLVFECDDRPDARGLVGLRTRCIPSHFRNVRVSDPSGRVLFAGLPTLPTIAEQWPPSTAPASASELLCLKGHGAPVERAEFSPDGRYVVSASNGRIWGDEVGPRKGPAALVATASSMRLWDSTTGAELGRLPFHPWPWWQSHEFAWQPRSKSFITVSDEAGGENQSHLNLRRWTIDSEKLQSEVLLPGRIDGGPLHLSFSTDGRRICACYPRRFFEWDITSKRLVRSLPGVPGGDTAFVRIAPDGSFALVAMKDGSFADFDLNTGKAGETRKGVGPTLCMAISPDSTHMVSAVTDRIVRLWDITKKTPLYEIGSHDLPVRAVAFSPDGRRVASGSNDLTVRVWDVETRKELARFTGHTAPVVSVAFSPDGTRLVSSSEDYTARVWKLPATDVAPSVTAASAGRQWPPQSADENRPPQELLASYRSRIDAAWPGLGKRLGIDKGDQLKLDLNGCKEVRDVTPLAGMRLHRLVLNDTNVRDIGPLRGMPLAALFLVGCFDLTSLDAVKGMPLEELHFFHASDLRPLAGLPLRRLGIQSSDVSNLTPLTGAPVTVLWLLDCPRLTDISALRSMPVTEVTLRNCPALHDLTPLHGMKLTHLNLSQGIEVSDLTWLKGMPLSSIWLKPNDENDVQDLSPLRGLALTRCGLSGCTKVKDFTPLAGMPLTELLLPATATNEDLRLFENAPIARLELIDNVRITDLGPLAKMPLEDLRLDGCQRLTDLSPLKGKS